MSPKTEGKVSAGKTREPPITGPMTAPNPQNIGINENAILWFEELDNSPKIVLMMLEFALNIPANICVKIASSQSQSRESEHHSIILRESK